MGRIIGTILVIGAFVTVLSGCERKGPAQKAGEAVDNAVDKTGQQFKKAGDNIDNAIKDKTQ